ncbi:hypothetical protein M9Y10_028882 [Tritrichomonas musculus]|uniref:Initiator binding domain-containing protein n=1 Tax=Tritrichomonas musculus TaxID=1915356 RepID=A0ABR2KMM5_9EUKA
MNNNDFKPPKYWELLNSDDQHIYREMHQAITAPLSKKTCRVDDFQEILDAINLFENINDDDKWKRCLVCGIFKVNDMIAVNICQLKSLIVKCKSSINGSLKKIGYGNIVKKSNVYELLFESIPYLKTNPSELRKWTMRYYTPIEKEDKKNDQGNFNANENSDFSFSVNDIQLNDFSLSSITNEDHETANSNNALKTTNENQITGKEKMTEPEAEMNIENNPYFSISDNNQPSIFDDKMTNWDESDAISDIYFNFL